MAPLPGFAGSSSHALPPAAGPHGDARPPPPPPAGGVDEQGSPHSGEEEGGGLGLGAYSPEEGFGELWSQRVDRLRAASPRGGEPGWRLFAMIVKADDELLQERLLRPRLAVSFIAQLGRVWSSARMPLRLFPYTILATSATAGLIEVVPDAKSLDGICKTASFSSLAAFFRARYGGPSSRAFYAARRNFVQSSAAYSVACYLLQIKDRHNGNILLRADGSVVHIDFGFLLSNSPGKNIGFESAPFKLTREWVEVMGGASSPWFAYFRLLVVRGYLEARRHREELLLSVAAAYHATGGSLPCFRAGEASIDAMRQRFRPHDSEVQAARFAASLVSESLDHWRTRTCVSARAGACSPLQRV
ncbi:hypothetical protein EMIHUDRAFT_69673 [Emiliania huxleyi CCMP1516]|uniref:1-phosphatidylinositol 4-kinase n=2 Tax=Emiliania huxleyi TaxID=2903 RepID=A0A0D3KXR1_EMIH1|nr:hypothetical protein EMIHUDRAFT_69673 [Emiliania huxleyi CCMP1516]EOD40546.1 hypothetical protein EMIHUDRAFT_69673 [Emiliania huxleyi CCMP1516]|eukprot:XP_005792975.1 hypothetical protein EMIHUDRAFT_69673 [Emiliania huxleyi CCMP1516]